MYFLGVFAGAFILVGIFFMMAISFSGRNARAEASYVTGLGLLFFGLIPCLIGMGCSVALMIMLLLGYTI